MGHYMTLNKTAICILKIKKYSKTSFSDASIKKGQRKRLAEIQQ